MINRIKGLTKEQRQAWEKDAIDTFTEEQKRYLNTASEEDKDIAFFNVVFKETFSDREDYNFLKNLSNEDAIAFWNANYDMKGGRLGSSDYTVENRYTVEPSEIKEGSTDIIKPDNSPQSRRKTFDDIFKLSASRDYINSNYEFDFYEFLGKEGTDKAKYTKDAYTDKPDAAYYTEVDNYSKFIRNKFDENDNQTYLAFKLFDEVANTVSPEYKEWKNTDKFNFNKNDIKDLMSYYYAIYDLTKDEEEANKFLSDYLQDRMAEEQSTSQKFWNGFKGIGASAIGSTIVLAGMLDSIFSGEAFNSEDYIEGVSDWKNFWNKAIDNELTRYGTDIMTYQTYDKDTIERFKIKGLKGGNIYRSVQEERGSLGDKVFNINFLAEMIQQHGFTVASGLASGASALFFKAVGKGVGYPVQFVGKIVGKNVDDAIKIVDNYADKVGGFLGAGLAGTGESAMISLDSKDTVLKNGQKLLEEETAKYVNNELNSYAETLNQEVEDYLSDPAKQQEINDSIQALADFKGNNLEAAETAYMQLIQQELDKKLATRRQELINYYKSTPEYKDKERELQESAIRAQNMAFTGSQIVTGFLNAGLKSTLLHPSVKKAFTRKRANPFIDKDGSIVEMSKAKEYWYKIKGATRELRGESREEYLQEITGGVANGWNNSSFEWYLENGTNEVGDDAVSTQWAAALDGAFKETLKSATSKDAFYAAISAAGSTSISFGNITGINRIADVVSNKDNATIKDWVGAFGELFVRSGVRQGWMNADRELSEYKKEADSIKEFMADMTNQGLHKDVVRMGNFISQRHMSTDSELNYRNSMLGEAVAEINTLERLKDKNRKFYNATIDNLKRLQTLEEGTVLANQLITEYRAANNLTEDVSDSEILETIKKNAKEFSDLRQEVLTAKKKVSRLFGNNLDIDVQNAYIYGELAYKDSEKRKETMNKELEETFNAGIDSTVTLTKDSNMSSNDKTFYIEHNGNFSKTTSSLKAKVAKVNEKIDALHDKSKLNRKEKQTLEELYKERKTLVEQIESFENKLNTLEAGVVLSEREIMGLSNKDRAKIMSKQFYDNTTEEQRAVIDNVKTILANGESMSEQKDSLIKIEDVAKLEELQSKHQEIRKKSGKELTEIYKTIKYNATNKQSESRIKDLDKITNYKEFRKIASVLFGNSETGLMDKINAKKLLKDNENYKKYLAQQKNGKILITKLGQLQQGKDFSKEDRFKQGIMTLFLNENDLTFKDTSKIENLLNAKNVEDFYRSIVKDIDPNVSFTEADIKAYKDLVLEAKQEVEKVEEIKQPIKVTVQDNTKPELDEEEPTSNISTEQSDDEEYNVDDNTRLISKTIFKGKPSDIITYIIKKYSDKKDIKKNHFIYYGAIYTLIQADVDKQKLILAVLASKINNPNNPLNIKDIRDLLGNKNITEDDIKAIEMTINNVKSYVDSKGDTIVFGEKANNYIEFIDKLIPKTSTETTISGNEEPTQTVIDNSEYTITPLDYVDKTLSDLAEKHKVENVKSIPSNQDTKVYFTVANDSPESTKENPIIYMLIESSEGTITIDNKTYQVIGVVRNTHSTSVEIALFDAATKQYDDLVSETETFKLIKKTLISGSNVITEEPVYFQGFVNKSKAPKHTQKDEEDFNLANYITGNSGQTIKSKLRDLINRLVTVKQDTSASVDTLTLSYKSPINGAEVMVVVPKKNPQAKIETFLAYIDKNGKSLRDNNGEYQIRVFVTHMKDILMNNGKTLLEFFKNTDNVDKLFDQNETNYYLSTYAKKIKDSVNSLNRLIELNSIGEEDRLFSKINRQAFLNQKVYEKLLKTNLRQLSKTLGKYINTSQEELLVKFEEDSEGGVTIILHMGDTASNVTSTGITVCHVDKNINITPHIPTNEEVFNFISDILLNDTKDDIRIKSETPLGKYQVDYEDIAKVKELYKEDQTTLTPEEKALITKVEMAVQNGLLYVSKDSLERRSYTISTYRSTDSFSSSTPSTPITPTEHGTAISKKGIVDTDSGVVLEERKPEEPVKEKSAIEKTLDALHKKYLDHQKKKAEGASITKKSVTTRNYSNTKKPIPESVSYVGNLYDSFIRRIIEEHLVEEVINEGKAKGKKGNEFIEYAKEYLSNKLGKEYPHFDEEELLNVFGYIEALIKLYKDEGYTLYSKPILLEGQLKQKDSEEVEEVRGIPDIIAYKETGECIIIDIKTRSYEDPLSLLDTEIGWKGQLRDYKSLFEQTTGFTVEKLVILPIEVSYNKDSKIVNEVLTDGLLPAKISSKFEQVYKDSLVKEFPFVDIDFKEKFSDEFAYQKNKDNTASNDLTASGKPKRKRLTLEECLAAGSMIQQKNECNDKKKE